MSLHFVNHQFNFFTRKIFGSLCKWDKNNLILFSLPPVTKKFRNPAFKFIPLIELGIAVSVFYIKQSRQIGVIIKSIEYPWIVRSLFISTLKPGYPFPKTKAWNIFRLPYSFAHKSSNTVHILAAQPYRNSLETFLINLTNLQNITFNIEYHDMWRDKKVECVSPDQQYFMISYPYEMINHNDERILTIMDNDSVFRQVVIVDNYLIVLTDDHQCLKYRFSTTQSLVIMDDFDFVIKLDQNQDSILQYGHNHVILYSSRLTIEKSLTFLNLETNQRSNVDVGFYYDGICYVRYGEVKVRNLKTNEYLSIKINPSQFSIK
jgi:hypothetical protein